MGEPGTVDTWPSLLARLRDADDRQSWRCFFARYWRLIYSFARRCGLPPSDAEDVVQEVVTEVFKAMPRFRYDPQKGRFRAFLLTITQHKVTDHFRGTARHPAVSLEPGDQTQELTRPLRPSDPQAEAAWQRDWDYNAFQLCLDQVAQEVDPKTFQAFQLYALEGWKAADTAQFLGLSLASVYVSKTRVIQRLRACVQRELGGDANA